MLTQMRQSFCEMWSRAHYYSLYNQKKTYYWSATYSKKSNQSGWIWISGYVVCSQRSPTLNIFDILILAVGCLIESETARFVRMQNLLPLYLARKSLACLASHIPLLMKHACSLTLRTVGNEKWMESFWNSVYDYHNTSIIEGVCLSCIVACYTKAMHYTKDTCTHVLQRLTIFALFFFPFSIDAGVLSPVGVSVFEQLKWFPFHFTSPFFLLI